MGISLRQRARRMAVRLAEMLPPPRDGAARQIMRSSRDLVSGRAPADPPKALQGAKVWAVPGTYNSPIVDVSEVQGQGSDAGILVEIPGIDLDVASHDAVWKEWAPHAAKWNETASDQPRRYHAGDDNIWFGPGSASLLAGALGAIRPRRFVEIGSGFSSAVVLDVNDEQRADDPMVCTFIEPYPDRLNSLLRPADHEHCTILADKVQAVDLTVFDQLESGDILFIDSSHIAKTGSDLLREIFEILPRLAPGVFVHFHDIFYPFDYPHAWLVKQNRSWNEPYFLRAFLMYNSEFRVHYWTDFHALFGTRGDHPLPGRASSIWLRRT